MLKWNKDELQKYKQHPLNFSETLDVKNDLQKRDERILDISPVDIKGVLFFDDGLWYTDFDMKAILTVPSSRSLEPVELNIDTHISEAYREDETVELDDDGIILEFENESINMNKAVEDNILLDIPTQILTEEEEKNNTMPTGNDWEVISEEEYVEEAEKPTPNPEFAKLKDLFKDKK